MTVSPLQGVSHACFGLSYVLAFGLELARLAWPAAGWRVAALGLGLAGVFAHTVYLLLNQPTPAAPYGSLLLLAWALAVFYLWKAARHARPVWAVFVLPVVIGLVGLSLALATSARDAAPPVDVPAWLSGERFWGAVHGTLVLLAAVGVSIGFLASVMYLVQTRRVRNKVNPARVVPLLSLERLENMNRRAVNTAFPLLTAGLLVGSFLLREEHGTAGEWLSLKVLSTGGLWVVFLVLLYLRYATNVPGRRLAVLSVAAFGLLLVALAAAHPFATGGPMNLRAIGCNVASAAVEVREALAFDGPKLRRALTELTARYGVEAAILGTCNRVELYLARPSEKAPVHAPLVAEFLGETHGVPADRVLPHLYEHADADAARHLFRVACGLDSVVVGEDQIAAQVKDAFETARAAGATGPLLNALFPHAARTSKRVRTETGLAQGQVSVASAAVGFLREVFDRFADKTVLVIGAGEMGRLTLTHIRELSPAAVLVTNRSPERAAAVAAEVGGQPVPWGQLDDALVRADIVVSTTGSDDLIMPRRRFDEKVLPRRGRRKLVVFDLAVPRDFDPRIDDGDRVCLYNVDVLNAVRDQQLAERRRHVGPAEAVVAEEVGRFVADWNRRQDGPVIGRLTAEIDRVRDAVVGPLLEKLNGRLTDADRAYVEGAFRLFQNRLLHGPIAALREAGGEAHGGSLRDALLKLFGLK